MNWDDLKIFATAARLGSFSQAADALRSTHSTVSRRVSALEQDLDLRLFDRHTTGLTLTPGGEELYTSAAAMQLEADSAERKVSGRDSQLQGVVRVSVIDAV
ncbi:MAG: LysR family transcriptional regulator, partial [Immundisolibacteraceae bacterium]|nr:LysR family transcriptional regulator [Immundisolibacteraceae bacterium]